MHSVDPEILRRTKDQLQANDDSTVTAGVRKIRAIKSVRDSTGLGLLEAKQVVDQLCIELGL